MAPTVVLCTQAHGVGGFCGRQQRAFSAWMRWTYITRAAFSSLQVRCLMAHQPGAIWRCCPPKLKTFLVCLLL